MAVAEARALAARPSRFEGFEAVTLAAGDLDATFVPELGMACVSLRHAGEELLDRRDGPLAYREAGTLMGIPLLHPWANRVTRLPGDSPLVRRDAHGLAIHGLLSQWRVTALSSRAGVSRVHATLRFPGARPFPHPHEVELTARLDERRLELSTTIHAEGAEVPVAFGFHPYLRLPGSDRRRWSVAFPRRRELALDARGIPTGRTRLRPPRRFALGEFGFDDAFDGIAAGASFGLAGGGRAIRVVHVQGFPVAQVYSPPGAQFLCLEPMTAPVDALTTGAGLRHARPGAPVGATFAIEVVAT